MSEAGGGHIWLIGMMGTGKSAVGAALADRLGLRFVDLDDRVVALAGCSIAELWGSRGEAAFRDLEAATVARVADAEPAVVATGGGVVLRDDNIDHMRRSGIVVWLTARPEVLAARIGTGAGRPLLAENTGADRLEALLAGRRPRYAATADLTVDTSDLSVSEVADALLTRFGAPDRDEEVG